ncbi:Neuronal pentraxin-1 [Merluccius polli]|uniref:Neuronal pentraxin-1 n=1 Tax=Merluccius polli TaxID=89951 RepID=A0AA47N872_MERPO|nr:Neuronal pentraxin-1 [Merluccius polli]
MDGFSWKLFVLSCLMAEGSSQDFGQTQFICTSVPKDMDLCSAAMQNSGPAEDLKPTVMELRETLLQQKETIMNQKETIRELTSKLSRCESQSLPDSGPGGRRPGSKNTMGDVSRGPTDTLAQLGHTLQTLKQRLENLEVGEEAAKSRRGVGLGLRVGVRRVGVRDGGSNGHTGRFDVPLQYSRGNNTIQANSLKDLLQNKIDDMEKQVLSRVNTLEETKPGPRNDTDQRNKVESTLTSLHHRITDLEKGKDNRPIDKIQLTFPLRTNYMYAKARRSLPEMYSFTVCLWIKSNASPGVGTPFSYAVPGQANEVVLIEWGDNPMEFLINDKVAKLPFLINDGKWHHLCITWTTRDGMWEAFQDGVMRGSGENLAPYHPIKPEGVLVLGQEQDSLGGGFDATQAFVGELANLNFWDRKLSIGEIYNLATCNSRAQTGNVFSWTEANIEIFGGTTKLTFEPCRSLN